MLLSGEEVLKWDVAKPKTVIEVGKRVGETSGMRGLAAKTAKQDEITKAFWEGSKITPVIDSSEMLKGG